jgi:hypothetical protein
MTLHGSIWRYVEVGRLAMCLIICTMEGVTECVFVLWTWNLYYLVSALSRHLGLSSTRLNPKQTFSNDRTLLHKVNRWAALPWIRPRSGPTGEIIGTLRVYLSNDKNPTRDRNCGSGYREQHGPGRRHSSDEFGSVRVCDIAGGGGMDLEVERKSMFASLQEL